MTYGRSSASTVSHSTPRDFRSCIRSRIVRSTSSFMQIVPTSPSLRRAKVSRSRTTWLARPVSLRFRELVALEQLREGADRAERVVHLVRHTREQLARTRQSLALGQPRAHL